MRTPLALSLLGALGLLAACTETTAPPRPTLTPPASATTFTPDENLGVPLRCNGDVASGTIRCRGASDSATLAAAPAGMRRVLVFGNQGVYIELISSNSSYTGGVFSMNVAISNLIAQTLGTNDTTPDGQGVRVFFAQAPVATAGTGAITIANADGTGTFTATNQPYYQYNGADLGADNLLTPGDTSVAKTWQFNIPVTVTNFTFTVYVAANVRYPNGYVDITTTPPTNALAGTSTTAPAVIVRTAFGDSVPGATPTFTSSTPGVATVDPSTGAITGVAPGKTTITITSGARTGTFTISICPNLAVGEAYQTSGAGVAEICFGGGGAAQEFTYIPYNTSTSSAASVSVTATGIQAVTGPPTPDRIPTSGPMLASLGTASTTGGGLTSLDPRAVRFLGGPIDHARITARPRMVWGATGGADLPVAPQASGRTAMALGALPADGTAYAITPGVPTVGSLMSLNVAAGCAGTPDNRVGMVRSVSTHTIVIADTANPAGGFTTAQYDSIALETDSIAYPVDSTNFGAPTDVDSNGRIILFYTRAVNELSPPSTAVTSYGYFTNRDVFSTDPISGCPRSNAGEILYELVPDPTGAVNSNVRTVSLVRGNTQRQIGHDLQHLINAFRRVYVTNASAFETGWLDEGLSQVAEELMFYRTGAGLAPRSNIVLSNLTTGPNASRRVAAFNTYANPNFTAFRGWLQRPDTVGTLRAASSLASKGLLWAFLRYAADRVNGSEPAFWQSLVNSNLEGRANIMNAIGGADVDSWQLDFYTAMYADDNAFSVAARFQTPSWNYRSVYAGLGGVPILARPLTNATPLTLSYASQGSAFIRFGVPASAYGTVTMLSGGVVPLTMRVSVVRTK